VQQLSPSWIHGFQIQTSSFPAILIWSTDFVDSNRFFSAAAGPNPRGGASGRYQVSESADHDGDSEGEHPKPIENRGKRDQKRRKTKAIVAPGEIERRERDQRRADLVGGDLDAAKGQRSFDPMDRVLERMLLETVRSFGCIVSGLRCDWIAAGR
jgi:hypothetical protein